MSGLAKKNMNNKHKIMRNSKVMSSLFSKEKHENNPSSSKVRNKTPKKT